jgi:hypothetical protein
MVDFSILILTGYEHTGRCFWCGGEFPDKRKRHYCSEKCSTEYHRHFEWNYASSWARERTGHRCQECGVEQKYLRGNGWAEFKTNLEVHHIIPLDGAERWFSILNVPCNLLVLCHDCHVKRHLLINLIEKGKSESRLQLSLF